MQKKPIRESYLLSTPPSHFVERLAAEMCEADHSSRSAVRGRTRRRSKSQIVAWHIAQVSNGPTETVNNLSNLSDAPPLAS